MAMTLNTSPAMALALKGFPGAHIGVSGHEGKEDADDAADKACGHGGLVIGQ